MVRTTGRATPRNRPGAGPADTPDGPDTTDGPDAVTGTGTTDDTGDTPDADAASSDNDPADGPADGPAPASPDGTDPTGPAAATTPTDPESDSADDPQNPAGNPDGAHSGDDSGEDSGGDSGGESGGESGADSDGDSGPDSAPVVAATWEQVAPMLGLMNGDSLPLAEKHAAGPVWLMLAHSPGRTALQLAADLEMEGLAGIESPTVTSILSRWQKSGLAIGDTNDAGVTRWTIGSADTVRTAYESMPAGPPAPTGTGRSRSRPAATGGTTTINATAVTKWAPGELEDWVGDYLDEHSDRAHTPGEVAAVIHAWKNNRQSPGAVTNSMVSLTEKRGRAVMVSARPVAYQSVLGLG